jgi:hypothetical protein
MKVATVTVTAAVGLVLGLVTGDRAAQLIKPKAETVVHTTPAATPTPTPHSGHAAWNPYPFQSPLSAGPNQGNHYAASPSSSPWPTSSPSSTNYGF